MKITEKERDLPIFDTDILKIFFFLPTAEITTQPISKIGDHTPAAEGLNNLGSLTQRLPILHFGDSLGAHKFTAGTTLFQPICGSQIALIPAWFG